MINNDPSWADSLKPTLIAFTKGPRHLVNAIHFLSGSEVTSEQIADYLEAADSGNQNLIQFRISIKKWDCEISPKWQDSDSTSDPRTTERRMKILDLLGFSSNESSRLNNLSPIDIERTVVIAKDFEPWYSDARALRSSMYWDGYVEYLAETSGWPADSIQSLDETTTEVVQRLSDPQRLEAKQTKGMVVGYVQSGKTANFTGVIAKAIDTGYRFVIVLTGTIELLRSQTQHRLDMELVGVENILDGQDSENPEVVRELDYQQDNDWIENKFIRHGEPLEQGAGPRIRRLTTHHKDYKRLTQGKTQLRFDGLARGKNLNDPENLSRASAYLAVVKKNPAALKKLIQDIRPSKHLNHLPILIIDDESDLASVDTTNPKKGIDSNTGERSTRTTINLLISELMKLCPRAQYIGYTATPFANVFINPDDDSDLFPSNFLLSLRRPPGYMGVTDFHDLDTRWDDKEPDMRNSNEKAYVRSLNSDPQTDPIGRNKELQEALDSFVLSAAIKKYRESNSSRKFKHHTMLVHESVKTADHADTYNIVTHLWKTNRYGSPESLVRLKNLWARDHVKVSAVRSLGEPIPSSFDELKPHLARAIEKLTEGGVPVSVVNSDPSIQENQQSIDFESQDVWRILVGGTKLSRGFTIEGLTVSYYRRRTLQADTMMQAGRWFGFRPGYQDLVRLYIRRDDEIDLYKAFEALLLDEESFRLELERYSGLTDDGHPEVEPWQIPPLVSQHLPWLRPTARNKMWNARITEKAVGGSAVDLYSPPPTSDLVNRSHNLHTVGLPLLRAATTRLSLPYRIPGETGDVTICTGIIDAKTMLTMLDPRTGMRWHEDFAPTFGPTLKFLQTATQSGAIDSWRIVWPQTRALTNTSHFDTPVPIVDRGKRTGRIDYVGSDKKHRDVAERLSGTSKILAVDSPPYDGLISASGRRGTVLIYLARDREAVNANNEGHDLMALISLVIPQRAVGQGGSKITWSVQQPSLKGQAAVNI